MPAWTTTVVRRIRQLARAGRVRFTLKAFRELAGLHLDADDAIAVLVALTISGAHARLRARMTASGCTCSSRSWAGWWST